MLNYQVVSNVNKALERLRRGSYGRAWSTEANHSRDSDQLILFTLESQARQHSQENLNNILAVARAYGQDLAVLKSNHIQVAGTDADRLKMATELMFPQDWRKEHQEWLDSNNPVNPRFDSTEHGHLAELFTWRPAMVMREHQGVYDVGTGKRLTNRRDIIERMWRIGFAAHRGRPLSIARQRWTGSRQELELVTDLARDHWDRQHTSDVAKKMVSAYRSINRYAAWPGAW
jgi:hypothetical protein